MPDEETSRLPPGYRPDLVSDPCIIILRGPDGAVVARFSRNVDLAPPSTRRFRPWGCTNACVGALPLRGLNSSVERFAGATLWGWRWKPSLPKPA
jgi:hypothetical protein